MRVEDYYPEGKRWCDWPSGRFREVSWPVRGPLAPLPLVDLHQGMAPNYYCKK
jgi:hypothetical protein